MNTPSIINNSKTRKTYIMTKQGQAARKQKKRQGNNVAVTLSHYYLGSNVNLEIIVTLRERKTNACIIQ